MPKKVIPQFKSIQLPTPNKHQATQAGTPQAAEHSGYVVTKSKRLPFTEPTQTQAKSTHISPAAPRSISSPVFKKLLVALSVLIILLYPVILVMFPITIRSYARRRLNIELFSIDSLLSLGGLGGNSINPIRRDKYNRTTVLVIGIDRGKERHSTLNTDTIMTLTYDHNTHRLYMISYPRDLYVKVPNTRRTYTKINAVYWYGTRFAGDGVAYLESTIKEITGLEVHYYVIVDFDGFRALIDALGGITVDNPRTFVDHYFPRPGGGYKTVKFEAGQLHLNGEQALEYARSRKAAGIEGSDFARAARQQRVVEAVLQKLLQELKKDPRTVSMLLDVVNEYFEYSTLSWTEINYLLRLYLQKQMPQAFSLVLQPSVANFRLLSSYSLPLYIVAPKHGLGEWYFVRLFVTDFLKYPYFISQLPKSISVYKCGPTTEFKKEYDLLSRRLFYVQLKQINTCPLTLKNNSIYVGAPNNADLIAQDLGKLTGYDILPTEEAEELTIKFYITKHTATQ